MASTPQKGRAYFGEVAETPGGNQTPGKASKKLKDSKFGETIVEENQVSVTVMLTGVALVEMGYDKELRDALQAGMYEIADAQGCINTYLPQHVTRNRILDFQGETWKDKRDTERPNKNYARAPGWSNVQYHSSTERCRSGSARSGWPRAISVDPRMKNIGFWTH